MSDSDSPTSASSAIPKVVDLHVVAAVIFRSGRILAAKRLPGGAASEKWEFPGGKIETGEAPADALVREIQEELGLSVSVVSSLGTYATVQGRHRIFLKCFWCSTSEEPAFMHAHSEVRWCEPIELRTLDWAMADIPAIDALLASTFLRSIV